MLFNSFSYMIFLPIVFAVYWVLPQRFRWILLLVSSYYFYMSWNPMYVLLILATTGVSYGCALAIERSHSVRNKKWCVAIALIISLGILFVFKYFDFFSLSICEVLQKFSLQLQPFTLNLVLPVGISFYTFQTLSYVIDVYRGKVKAERHFGIYATFVSFFPQLVAGPIERTENLLPQIRGGHTFDGELAFSGIRLIMVGFFKKLVVADLLAEYVDHVYQDVTAVQGAGLLFASILFAIQIYCDFSGYSDIAIGSARLFGIKLMKNFRAPYLSKSIREFWSRWHISLSTWFRDYVYIPLGGNRCSKLRHSLNLITTFLVSGLWHGANWTYVVWGGIHGMGQVIEIAVTAPFRKRKVCAVSHETIGEGSLESGQRRISLHTVGRWIGSIVRICIVFCFCSFAWIFFRAESISDAGYVLCHMFDGIGSIGAYITGGIGALGIPGNIRLIYIVLMIFVLWGIDVLSSRDGAVLRFEKKPAWVQWTVYICFLAFVIVFAQKGVAAEFVYFQF